MKKNIKILFVGNSLTYYNFLPEIVRGIFESAGINAECVLNSTGGKCLDYHANKTDTEYNIKYGHYDYVVLQGKAGGFEPEPFLQGGRKIINEWISGTGSVPVLYMVWCLRGHRADQPVITDANVKLASETGARIAPVGEAWPRFERIHGMPDMYREDGNHPTVEGSYCAAATVYYAITGRNRALALPVEGGMYEKCGLSRDMAEKIHRIACNEASKYAK